MARRWCFVIIVIALVSVGAAQSTFIRVPSDLAASHLQRNPAPTYPPMAQMARIQGNVILRVAIDPAGNPSPVALVTGHPMLIPAAMEGVRRWKYAPFEANGRPVSVVTIAVVRFGNPTNHDAEDRAEVLFQDKFWAAIDGAQAALDNTDSKVAEQSLADAKTLLGSTGSVPPHAPERWQYFMLMGTLLRNRKQVEDAEQQYTQALDLQKANKESPELAASLSALGALYYESNRPQIAAESLKKAVSIYQKKYKQFAKSPREQSLCARSIANDALILSKIAAINKEPEEAARQCRAVLDVSKSLADNDPNLTECKRVIAAPVSAAQ